MGLLRRLVLNVLRKGVLSRGVSIMSMVVGRVVVRRGVQVLGSPPGII